MTKSGKAGRKAGAVGRKAASVDRALTHAAARHDDGAMLRAVGAASELADQPPLIALASATIAAGALLRRPGVARTGVRMLASHLLATGIKTVIKRSVDRTRPAKAIERGRSKFAHGHSRDHDETSFPSGHTAGAVAVARAVAVDAPRTGLAAQAAAVAVGAVQMPRGKHYISDVAAGAAIGWVAEKLASAALRRTEAAVTRRLARSRTDGEPAGPPPGSLSRLPRPSARPPGPSSPK